MLDKTCRWIVWAAFLLTVLPLSTSPVDAQQEEKPKIAQLIIGQMIIPNDNDQVSGGDYDIPLIGFSFQNPEGGDRFEYGLEGGALFSWKSDTRSFAASGGGGGGTISISLDIEDLLADLFFGIYTSYEPTYWFRAYIGAGPLIVYGRRETEQTNPSTLETSSSSDSGWGVGGYARVGLDFILTDSWIFGLGIRGVKTGLTFSDSTGDVDVEGFQYYVGISSRF